MQLMQVLDVAQHVCAHSCSSESQLTLCAILHHAIRTHVMLARQMTKFYQRDPVLMATHERRPARIGCQHITMGVGGQGIDWNVVVCGEARGSRLLICRGRRPMLLRAVACCIYFGRSTRRCAGGGNMVQC